MDVPGTGKYDLNKYCAVLAKQFPFAQTLNSQARQASAERAWSAISRFGEIHHVLYEQPLAEGHDFDRFRADAQNNVAATSEIAI